MKRSRWIALNSLLGAGAAALLALNLLPGPGTGSVAQKATPVGAAVRAGTAPGSAATQTAASVTRQPSTRNLAASSIAAAFGWVRPVVAAPAPPPPEAPKAQPVDAGPKIVDAAWITLVGTITQSDGTTFYYFKNGKTGTIMQLSTETTIAGWTLQIPKAGEFLIENADEHYRVGKAR